MRGANDRSTSHIRVASRNTARECCNHETRWHDGLGINSDITQTSLISTKPAQWVYGTMFDQLVSFDPKTFQVRPKLAESWSVSPDGMEWTLNLRKDVKWDDGVPFTSRDVKFTLDAVMDPNVNAAYHRPNLASVASVEIDGDYVVRLEMKVVDNEMINLLGDFMHMYPAHLLTGVDLNNATAFLEHPIGTGPFMFKEHVEGVSYTVVANPNYWKGRPNLDSIVFKVIPDGNALVSQLKAGEVDFADQLSPDQMKALQTESTLTVTSVPSIQYWHIFINNTNPMVSDPKVRQALAYGLDRAKILKDVLNNKGELASGPVSPILADWRNTNLTPFPYDPDKAKGLLAEAGWTPGPDGILQKTIDGKMTQFKADMIIIPFVSVWLDIGLIAQQNWKQIGVDIQIKQMDNNTGNAAMIAGNYVFDVGSRNPIPSPADIRRYFGCTSGGNRDRYCNKQVDDLLAQIQFTTDFAKQRALFDQVQQLIHEDQPSVFLFYVDDAQAYTYRLGGFTGTDMQRLVPNIGQVGFVQ